MLPPADQSVILPADDEPTVGHIAPAVLEGDGYFVLDAGDGEEALLVARRYPGTIHLLDGFELRDCIALERPATKIALPAAGTNAQMRGAGVFPSARNSAIPGPEVLRMAGRAINLKKDQESTGLTLEERIRARAHEIYLQRNGQEGSELDDWLQAEAEIRDEAGSAGHSRSVSGG